VPDMNRFIRGIRSSRSWDKDRAHGRDVDSSSFVPQPPDFHLRRGYNGTSWRDRQVTSVGASERGKRASFKRQAQETNAKHKEKGSELTIDTEANPLTESIRPRIPCNEVKIKK